MTMSNALKIDQIITFNKHEYWIAATILHTKSDVGSPLRSKKIAKKKKKAEIVIKYGTPTRLYEFRGPIIFRMKPG